MVLSKMNCCSKSGIQKYAPKSHIHVQIVHRVVMFSSADLPDDRKKCFRMMNCGWRHVRIVWPLYLLSFWTSLAVWFTGCKGFLRSILKATAFPVTTSSLPIWDSERSTSPDSSFVATSSPVAMSINPPKYASCSCAWELDAAPDFVFLILLSGFP